MCYLTPKKNESLTFIFFIFEIKKKGLEVARFYEIIPSIKLQAFSFTKSCLLFLVFFQGTLKGDLEMLSDL